MTRAAETGLNPSTLAVVLAGFCSFLDLYATQPLLPMLARIFGASTVTVSLTVTAATAGVALAAPMAGRIADRFGRKRVIVSSAAFLAVSTLLAATSSGLQQLIWWRFVQGILTPGIFAITVAYIHEEWPAGSAGAATAAYVTGTVLGGFCGRLISGFVALHFSWQAVFVVLGVLNGFGALALWLWLPREQSFNPVSKGASTFAALVAHMTNGRLLATYAVGFCVLFSLLGTFTYVTFYLAAPPFHLSSAALGSIFFVYLVGAVITPLSGPSIDRYGHRAALALAVAIGVAGVALTLGHRLWMVALGLAVCSSGVFVAQSAASSYVGIAAERDRALAVGLYVTFYYAGGSAGAVIPGLLWKFGWPACVALVAAVQLITVGIALTLWSPSPSVHAGRDRAIVPQH